VRTQFKEGRREIIGKWALNRRVGFEQAAAVVAQWRGERWE